MAATLNRSLRLITATYKSGAALSALCLRLPTPESPPSSLAHRRFISAQSSALGTDNTADSFRSREEQRDREQSAQLAAESAAAGAGQTADAEARRVRVAAVRDRILAASLPFVGQLGWSREALEAGAQSVQLPSVAHGLFPGGGFELVEYFARQCDVKLAEFLQEPEQRALLSETTTSGAPVRFVSAAIQYRLQLLEPMLAVWPQAMGLRVQPANAAAALGQLQRMADEICYQAGDRSADFNWYTRRLAVASLYKLAELHLLQDSSVGHTDTWAFLQRRVGELAGAQDALAGSGQVVQQAAIAIRSVFETIRNMSGIPLGRA